MGVILSVLKMVINAVTLPMNIFKNFMAIMSFIFFIFFIVIGVLVWKSWDDIYRIYETIVGTGKDAKDGLLDKIGDIQAIINELNSKLDELNAQNKIKSIQFK